MLEIFKNAEKNNVNSDNVHTVKLMTICNARDLWNLTRSCEQVHLLCPTDLWNLPGAALRSRLKDM